MHIFSIMYPQAVRMLLCPINIWFGENSGPEPQWLFGYFASSFHSFSFLMKTTTGMTGFPTMAGHSMFSDKNKNNSIEKRTPPILACYRWLMTMALICDYHWLCLESSILSVAHSLYIWGCAPTWRCWLSFFNYEAAEVAVAWHTVYYLEFFFYPCHAP